MCLDSILRQIYSPIELIVIDDGSTDGTEKIIDEYSDDKRVRIIHQNNMGSSVARNKGIDMSQGEWISFIDADDWISRFFYSEMIKLATGDHMEVLMCNIETNGQPQRHCIEGTFTNDDLLLGLLMRNIPNRVTNKIYRKSTVDNIRFNERRNLFEDGPWTARVLSICSHLIISKKAFYHYRLTPNSLSRKKVYSVTEKAEFWTNKLERDCIIIENLRNPTNRTKAKPKLLEHIEEARLYNEKDNSLLNQMINRLLLSIESD